MDLRGALNRYLKNFSTAFSFVLLLVFVLPFILGKEGEFLASSFVSSATVFIDYGFINEPLLNSALLLALAFVFLFCYSVLVCLMVLAVRGDLSNVKMNNYLAEKIGKFAFRYFRFLALFTIIASIAGAILIAYGLPIWVLNLLLMFLSASFLFLPQTIVVDEESLGSSIFRNWDFISKNMFSFVQVLALGVVSLFLLQLIEFALDYFFFVGSFVSLLIGVVFLVPFIEVVKTQIYMHRFGLIKSYHPSG
ncbi:MAG: hypothetical protein AABW99_00570 [archaeon]